MLLSTFVLRLMSWTCFLAIPAVPILGAYVYSEGPEWLKVGNGTLLAWSLCLLAIILFAAGACLWEKGIANK